MPRLFSVLLLVLIGNAPLRAEIPIVIETTLGSIEVSLDDSHAPRTVANFLKYVDAGRYNGGIFHRTVRSNPDNQPQSPVKIDVIQASVNPVYAKQDFPSIALERTNQTGLQHVDGAISMARDKPDSATSDFFLCVGDQPELNFGGKRNPDLQGFAVFGKVTKGMDVVRRIHASPSGPSGAQESVAAGNQKLTPPVRILRVARR